MHRKFFGMIPHTMNMAEEPAQASEVLWIDEENYHFVCEKRHSSWSNPIRWVEFSDDWRENNSEVYEQLSRQDISCELCQYDKNEITKQIQQNNLEFEEVPELIKGDIFESLQTDKQFDIDIKDTSEVSDIDLLEKKAKEELIDELDIEEAPKSIAEQQREKLPEVLFPDLDRDFDLLIARHYGRLLAEYKHAMNEDVWDFTKSGILGESLGRMGFGFLQPFIEDFLTNLEKSKDANQNAENLADDIDDLEHQLGSALREPFEYFIDQSDKELGRYYLLMVTMHHERLKDGFS